MKIGDIVKYNNYEWNVIKIENETVTLMMKDVLSEDEINELFDDKDYVNDNYVVYSKYNYNDWANTYIRKVLNSKFLDKFNKEELNIMTTNYNENKFADDYVRIPTAWEIRDLDKGIKCKDECYWTMTGSPSNFSGYDAFEFGVDADGDFDDSYVGNTSAVVPVINLNTEILNNKLAPSSDIEKRIKELEDRVKALEDK